MKEIILVLTIFCVASVFEPVSLSLADKELQFASIKGLTEAVYPPEIAPKETRSQNTDRVDDTVYNDHNDHYASLSSVGCEDVLIAVSDSMEEAGVFWNSTVIGGDEFDNANNNALGFKAIGIGSVAESDDIAPYAYYIVEFAPDSVVLTSMDVGGEFRLYREATVDYPAGEMCLVVSAVNGNCVMCVLDFKGPVTCESSVNDDWVATALLEAFTNIEI